MSRVVLYTLKACKPVSGPNTACRTGDAESMSFSGLAHSAANTRRKNIFLRTFNMMKSTEYEGLKHEIRGLGFDLRHERGFKVNLYHEA